MALETFRLAGLAIEVKSDLLDEVIVFASDNAAVVGGERRPIYRARELLEIWAVGRSRRTA